MYILLFSCEVITGYRNGMSIILARHDEKSYTWCRFGMGMRSVSTVTPDIYLSKMS